jgi:hypothetical protein
MTSDAVLTMATAIIVGIAVAAARRSFDISERGRIGLKSVYTSTLPLWFRNLFAAPVAAVGLIPALFALLFVLPRVVAAWTTVPIMVLCLVSLVLSYRVPAPWLPRWLREEISSGTVPVARPDAMDWAIFGLFGPIFLAGAVAAAYLSWQMTIGAV